jgi:hypothetical protein
MSKTEEGPDWVCVTKHAQWEPRDSCVELVFKDHLWIMGGWFRQDLSNPRDVWKSADGSHWEKVIHQAPWEKSDLPLGLVFRGRMWHMGGRSLPGTECSNEVWSTEDGETWELATSHAGWIPRLGAGGIVFNDRMWLMGGTSDFYHSNEETLCNDIWSSADGVDWTLECSEAPWSRRAYHKIVELHGKLWLTAGGGAFEGKRTHNDVWCSEDGIHWDCVVEHAPWLPRFWHGSVVYRDRIWVIAGDDNLGTRFLNDVWYSTDGRDWTQVRSDVVFSKRHEISPYVFQDKIWVAAGHARPLSNEVWSLQLPADA